MEPKLRDFRSADLEPVHGLIRVTIDACYRGVYPHRAVRFFKDHHTPERILERQAQGHVLVVESDGELVATGAIVADHVMAVFVVPRCQRHGLGTSVMEALEDEKDLRGGGS